MRLDDRGSILDRTNIAIVELLHEGPRIGMSELGRRVGMSAPAVTERVRRLEATGVIRGWRVDIDPAAVGLPIAAYVRIRPTPGQLPKIAELARGTAEVVECHRITGEDCYLMKVHVASVEQLEDVLDGFALFGQTTTSIVQSSPVPSRPPPLRAGR